MAKATKKRSPAPHRMQAMAVNKLIADLAVRVDELVALRRTHHNLCMAIASAVVSGEIKESVGTRILRGDNGGR